MSDSHPQNKSPFIEYLWRELRLSRRFIRYLLEKGPPWQELFRLCQVQPRKILSYLPQPHPRQIPSQPLRLCQSHPPGPFCTYWDAEYPTELRELADPPLVLYFNRPPPEAGLETAPRLAIVGTRRASEYAKELTQDLMEQMQAWRPWIFSGLAWGIDAVAHRQALQLGFPTVGILGTPLTDPPGLSRLELFHQMKEQAYLITELYPGGKQGAFRFPERNRLIAALAQAVLVIEAPGKSGALITAQHALDLGREVFVVPGPLKPNANAGGHALIQEGARLLTHAKEIFSVLGVPPLNERQTQNPCAPSRERTLDEVEESVLGLLSSGAQHIDKIIHISQKPAPQVLSALTRLALAERVLELAGGLYRKL